MSRMRAQLLRFTPTLALSRFTGWLARLPVPRPLRATLWAWLGHSMGVDLTEAAEPLVAYPNFTAFFTRTLRPGARPVDPDPDALVSPVDGRVVAAGPLEGCPDFPIKGARFTPAELLGDHAAAQELEGGAQITLYLSPADYHRIHAPVSGAVEAWRHLAGRLLPVNPPTLAAVERVFPRNERVVSCWADRDRGRVLFLVLVGALNVGSIRVLWDPALGARPGRQRGERRTTALPRRFVAGEEAARFELGSTVVLLAGPGAWEPLDLAPGQRVLQGQSLARWSGSKGAR